MSLFRTAALKFLSRRYQFIGDRISPERVDLVQPISLVHDVGRELALESIQTDRQAGGFFQVGQDNVHAVANTQENTVDVYGTLDASWGSPGERWCWLMDSWVTANATVITAAQLSLGIPALGSALAQRDVVLGVWGQQSAFHDVEGTGFSVAGLLNANTQFEHLMRPIFIPPGSAGLGFRSVSSAAGTIRLSTICWVGPLGVYPPGVA